MFREDNTRVSVVRINGGVIQRCSNKQKCIVLRPYTPGMFGNSYHRAKDGVSPTLLKGFYDLLKGRFEICQRCRQQIKIKGVLETPPFAQ